MSNKIPRKYTWVKDPDTTGDIYRNFKISRGLATVTKVDLRPDDPPVVDQEQIGSCTANAVAGAYQFQQNKNPNTKQIIPSRLFIYYNSRTIEGDINDDAGSTLKTTIQTVTNTGVCSESNWPYDITKWATKPPAICYSEAIFFKSKSSKRVIHTLDQMKQCLIEGYPFVFGIMVYASFESDQVAKTGIVPAPNTSKELELGGHAMACVGFNDKKKHFIVRNSWGSEWGDKGYCYITYNYMANMHLVSDLWTIKAVSNKTVQSK